MDDDDIIAKNFRLLVSNADRILSIPRLRDGAAGGPVDHAAYVLRGGGGLSMGLIEAYCPSVVRLSESRRRPRRSSRRCTRPRSARMTVAGLTSL